MLLKTGGKKRLELSETGTTTRRVYQFRHSPYIGIGGWTRTNVELALAGFGDRCNRRYATPIYIGIGGWTRTYVALGWGGSGDRRKPSLGAAT